MLRALWCSMQKSLHTPEQFARFLTLLRQTRRDQQVTQVELSERIGLPQSDISKVERGVRRLDLLELRAWLKGLGVSPVEFLLKLEAAFDADAERNRRMQKRVK
ncbi:helix-turn-helix domain-containing protein [Aquabacterium sp. NJ1]|uniref:helix-turn-helix domain-containing protein n=1 Tax=Aquabacterium sp. NJ1 TaxID=1538295 RepID=UPI00350F5071